jgi:hypothetical protein
LAEEYRNDVVLKETVRLFSGVHYRGLGYLEMKRDRRTGKHLIIEANIGRPTGRSAMAEAGGVELHYAMYRDAVGQPLSANLEQKYEGVKWIYLRQDLQSALYMWWAGELTLREWWQSWRGRKAYALFSWTDPVPFLADLKRVIGLLVSSRRRNQRSLTENAARPLANDAAREDQRYLRIERRNQKSFSDQEKIDYDIHGLVGIRLINPSFSDAAAVARQLGPLQSPLPREPDIVVRFVKHLPTPGLRFLGPKTHGFTDDGYFILRSSRQKAKVRVPFDQIGKQCVILCESGLRSVPLLTAILNLTILKKDYVPLHASAFKHKETGVLVMGWAKGGKTEALLAFALQGAEYVGDEWVLLSGDGQKMYGLPENIDLSWHLEYLPHVRRKVSREERLLFKGIQWLDRTQDMIPNGRLSKIFPVRLLREAMPKLRSQLSIRVEARTIFGRGFGSLTARPEKLFLMVSHQDPSIDIEPSDPLTIARRMLSAIWYEQLPFMGHYQAFKFAFPGKKNDFIENAHALQTDILYRALAGKEAYTVRHPYPASFPHLYGVMRPFVERAGDNSDSVTENYDDKLVLESQQQMATNVGNTA